jgi:hypothetical protein
MARVRWPTILPHVQAVATLPETFFSRAFGLMAIVAKTLQFSIPKSLWFTAMSVDVIGLCSRLNQAFPLAFGAERLLP